MPVKVMQTGVKKIPGGDLLLPLIRQKNLV